MSKIYKFKKPRGKKIDAKPSNNFQVEKADEVVGLIHGQTPGSTIEWYVSQALDRLHLNYEYQMPIGGGRLFRGGKVLDFLVYTVPYPTPLTVLGDYWHGGTKDDVSLELAIIKRLLGHNVRDAQPIWEHEARTADMAYSTLKRKIA